MLREFVEVALSWNDYRSGPGFEYVPAADDQSVREICFQVLRARKGAKYAGNLIERCSKAQLPAIIVEALLQISNDIPNQLPLEAEVQAATVPVDNE